MVPEMQFVDTTKKSAMIIDKQSFARGVTKLHMDGFITSDNITFNSNDLITFRQILPHRHGDKGGFFQNTSVI